MQEDKEKEMPKQNQKKVKHNNKSLLKKRMRPQCAFYTFEN